MSFLLILPPRPKTLKDIQGTSFAHVKIWHAVNVIHFVQLPQTVLFKGLAQESQNAMQRLNAHRSWILRVFGWFSVPELPPPHLPTSIIPTTTKDNSNRTDSRGHQEQHEQEQEQEEDKQGDKEDKGGDKEDK